MKLQTVINLRQKSKRCKEDLEHVYNLLTPIYKQWYFIFLRATEAFLKTDLAILAPDQATFNKVHKEIIYESHAHRRQRMSTDPMERKPRYSIHNYSEQIGAGEDEVNTYIDCKYHGVDPAGNYLASTWLHKVREAFNFDATDSYLPGMMKRQQEVTAPANEAAAKDFHSYIEGLLERNRGIIERGEAVWQQELEDLINMQTADNQQQTEDNNNV